MASARMGMATIPASVGTADVEQTVLAALEVLYQKHLQPEQQQAADAYLRKFQLTPDAFSVCVALVERVLPQYQAVGTTHAQQNQLVPILFFAAQTLANKLRRQPAQSQWPYVRWSKKLLQWLTAGKTPRMVQTQLILALVACFPRLSRSDILSNAPILTESSSALAAVVSVGAMPDSVMGFVLGHLTSAHVHSGVIAELLVIVVEEVCELQEQEARERLQQEMDRWTVLVLDQVLPQIMHDTSSGSGVHSVDVVSTQQLVLRAVRNWLRYTSVSPVVVMQNPLMQSVLVFLSSEELFDVSVDLVVDVVRCYTDVQRDLPLIQWLVPQIMQLRTAFHAAAKEEDTDKCLGLCRIFTEMAESYIDLLFGDQDMSQVVVVDLLLDCMSYPDSEIADVTIPFWFRFLGVIQHLGQAQKEIQVAKFTSSLIRLASICMQNLQFQDNFPKLPFDKQQDFKWFRQELGDILRDCCEVLGVISILQHCVQGLKQIFQSPPEQRRWEAIEAHLYCFRSIARQVEQSDPANVSAPIQLIFQHLPQFSEHPAICYTSCLIISRYADWLKANQSHLPQQMEFLNKCIMSSSHDPQYGEWEVARAAATAIRSLATDCWELLGQDAASFYLYVESHDLMAVEDQVLILEGVCAGAAKSRDMSSILSLLEKIIEPIGRRLTALFASSAAAGTNATVAMNEMLRLICIYEYLDVNLKNFGDANQQHPLVMLTEQIWPMFNQILVLFRGNDNLVERVCRCYKRILRTCGYHFKPFLPQMIDNILSFYLSEPKSSYLYTGSMILKYFSSDDSSEMQNLFVKMLHTFAEATFPFFKNVTDMRNHPDLVEEFFFLMERSVKCVPHIMTARCSLDGNPLLSSIFQCAVVSLEISHNDANKGTLCFLEEVFVQALGAASPNVKMASFETILRQSLFSEEVNNGRQLVNHLLRGVVLSSISTSRVDTDYGSIAGVLVQMARLDGQAVQEWTADWFAQATAGAPSSAVVGFITVEEAQEFQHNLFTSSSERTFRRTIRHFGKLCASRNASLTDDGQD